MKRFIILLLLAGCQPSFAELQAKRDELAKRQRTLFHEIIALEDFTSGDFDRTLAATGKVPPLGEDKSYEQALARRWEQFHEVTQRIETLTAELAAQATQ